MIVVLPFHAGDIAAAKRLLEFIGLLSGRRAEGVSTMDTRDATLLLSIDNSVSWQDARDVLEAGNQVFGQVRTTVNAAPVSDWTKGANSLWFSAARYIETSMPEPWLWLEPDCVPLKKEWFQQLKHAYSNCGKPFLACCYRSDNPMFPGEHVSGVAVYPANAYSRLGDFEDSALPFDLACRHTILPECANTRLIQHFWGKKDLPPTFVQARKDGDSINTMGLDSIWSEAVLFHRNKDGSLMRLIAAKMGASMRMEPHSNRFVTVFNFCNKDGELLRHQLYWINELGGCHIDDCVLAYDPSTSKSMVHAVSAGAACFRSARHYVYPLPPSNHHVQAANHAFMHVADYMQSVVQRPWLWYEADMTALRPGWMDALQDEYARCRKAFMGPLVHCMGHFNGTSIYPANTFDRCPSLRVPWRGQAFDCDMRDEMAGDSHDASHLMIHAWVMVDGRIQPAGHGTLPSFPTERHVRMNIPAQGATFHRIKDTSLIERLRELRQGVPAVVSGGGGGGGQRSARARMRR